MDLKDAIEKKDFKSWCINNGKEYLLEEWDSSNVIMPDEISHGSHKIVKWICSNGHSFEKSIHDRCMGTRCPKCTGVVFNHRKSISEECPDLIREWDFNNNSRLPSDISCGSDYMAWWICAICNKKYQMRVSHRTSGHGCPYCSNKKVAKGYNDLKSYCIKQNMQYVIDEWDIEKNSLKPEDYLPQSNKKVWWICPLGHSYNMSITHRTSRMGQCPMCNRENKTSFAEQAIFYYLKNEYIDVINCDLNTIGLELDIYIPSINTAIEYDGFDMHRNRVNQDEKKNELCLKNHIRLIRIREGNLPLFENCICINRIDYTKLETLNDVIYDLFAILGIKTKKIDVKRDASNIYSQYMSIIKENNFEELYPQIAKEWNYKKNKNIKPNMFGKASNKKVWWICNRGHEWQSSINKRTIGRGCPICSNKMLKKGENDIVSYCEQNDTLDVLQDWDYKKNNELGLIIDEMFPGTIEKVWWKCHICGYEWMSSVNNRVKKRHMCPSCRKSLAIGQNRKKVLNCETGVVYNSISEAARITNIKSSNISSVCTGKTKTAGGFHWKYCK